LSPCSSCCSCCLDFSCANSVLQSLHPSQSRLPLPWMWYTAPSCVRGNVVGSCSPCGQGVLRTAIWQRTYTAPVCKPRSLLPCKHTFHFLFTPGRNSLHLKQNELHLAQTESNLKTTQIITCGRSKIINLNTRTSICQAAVIQICNQSVLHF
jgi:hypothetical protein